MPAVGKLTVARELATLTGYRLFHNHLAVDLLLAVFDFGTPPFVELRESIWLSVFDQAFRARLPGLIFTFNPESTVRQRFVDETVRIAGSHGGEVIFAELTCSREEIEKRIESPSRQSYGKLTSVEQFRELQEAGAFSGPALPPPRISVDTGAHPPAEAAALIARECGLPFSASR